jgi:hypothetical protein
MVSIVESPYRLQSPPAGPLPLPALLETSRGAAAGHTADRVILDLIKDWHRPLTTGLAVRVSGIDPGGFQKPMDDPVETERLREELLPMTFGD